MINRKGKTTSQVLGRSLIKTKKKNFYGTKSSEVHLSKERSVFANLCSCFVSISVTLSTMINLMLKV